MRPIDFGADIVVHSATKFIGGHGTAIGGVIVDSGKSDWKSSGKYRGSLSLTPATTACRLQTRSGRAFVTYIRAILLRDTETTLSPFHAFIFLQGLDTLAAGRTRHVENALKIVNYLKTTCRWKPSTIRR